MNEIIIWPEWLDIPLRDEYNYSPADRRAKADMEIGSRYRVLFDTDETTLSCNFYLRHDQRLFFESFEKHVLRQGSVWFEMPLLTGMVVEKHTVRFKERPKIGDFKNGYAIVSMVLDLEERKTYDEIVTWFIYWFGPNGISIINRLHEVLHVEMPGVTDVVPSFFPRIGENADQLDFALTDMSESTNIYWQFFPTLPGEIGVINATLSGMAGVTNLQI
jgi:hypothetical protein